MELVESKFFGAAARDGLIERPGLVQTLRSSWAVPLVLIQAPPGYGKTTLLGQWAEGDARASAWLTLDTHDNDPVVLLTHLAVAVDRVVPLAQQVFDALATPGASIPGMVVPRLGGALAQIAAPVLLVLDDAHVLEEGESLDALVSLIPYLANGCQFAMAARFFSAFPLGRLRADGRVMELGRADLAFDVASSGRLVAAAGLSLPRADVVRLHERTEGWAVGLYLAALSARHGSRSGTAPAPITDNFDLVADYVRTELLSRLSAADVNFLTGISVLERFCGPLCDAVLSEHGSAVRLERFARSNLLLVPLDGTNGWYRYHGLFRDVLRAQLDRSDLNLHRALLQRAAQWCEEYGMGEAAVEYAIAANDVGRIVRLVGMIGSRTLAVGRASTLSRWFDWLERVGALAEHPESAAQAAITYALTGHPAAADYWRMMAERATSRSVLSSLWLSGARAYMCPDGPDAMLLDARDYGQRVRQLNRVVNREYVQAIYLEGAAKLLLGDPDAALACFEDVNELGHRVAAFGSVINANANRAILAMENDDWTAAGRLIDAEVERVRALRLGALMTSAVVFATAARHEAHTGDERRARAAIVNSQRLRPLLSYAVPWYAVMVLLELANASLALEDQAAATTMLREMDAVLSRRPRVGILTSRVERLRMCLDGQPPVVSGGVTSLTAAELRALPLLSTHLTMGQMATRLSVSRSTIKTHVTSLYQKLDAHSRAEAVARAQQIGLLAS